jgi:hypothetical protein
VGLTDERRELTASEQQRVLGKVEERGFTCGNCGSGEFRVGEALYVGFLFLSEDRDNYVVAITCTNTDCRTPRTGIKLSGAEFLS